MNIKISNVMYKLFFKRFSDVLLSGAGLVLLSPVFVLVTVGLFFANGGKPFFVQERPGRNGVLFKIVKFKTMNDCKDTDGNLLPDGQRLTTVGRVVRKTSLDELPQLLNVLFGTMSLIGPRPLLPEYLPLYDEFQRQRHAVRPGITGWAQVNGRNAIGWNEKFAYDVWYVTHLSFILDARILLMTLKKVFVREGITAEGSATAEKFKGN